MQDFQKDENVEISDEIKSEIEPNSQLVLDGSPSIPFTRHEVQDFENPGKIAEEATCFVFRHIVWFVFVELIHSTLSSLTAMLHSFTLIGHFMQEHSYAGVFKTLLLIVGLFIFLIGAVISWGSLFLIPFFFLWIYSFQTHLFKKLYIPKISDFGVMKQLKNLNKQELEKFSNEKLVSLLQINLFVTFSAFLLIILLNNIFTIPLGGVQIGGSTLNYDEIFLNFTFFIVYMFSNSFVRLAYVVVYVQKAYGNTLKNILHVYKKYFLEFMPLSIAFSVVTWGIIAISELAFFNYVSIYKFSYFVNALIIYIVFSIENTFWVMFVKSRLPALKKFYIECETKMFATGTSETGEIIRKSSHFAQKYTTNIYDEAIVTNEDVWNVELEDVVDDEKSETFEKVDDSINSNAKITEN